MKKLIIITVFLVLLTPAFADAACPATFQNIPFVTDGDCSTEGYVNALYQLTIALASILVVLRLIWAGAQYMLSEVVTNKEAAKKEIKASLLGLLIILGAVTILNTINPNLTNLNFLDSAGKTGTPLSNKRTWTSVSDPSEFGKGSMFLTNCEPASSGAFSKCDKQKATFKKACEENKEKAGSFEILPAGSSRSNFATYFCL